jgi:ferric-dicitrate binding protein FerR (iron transport regulator)
MIRIAAVFLIPLFSILTAYWYVQNQPPFEDVALMECYVPNGEIREIRLPDSSSVLINSGSALFYPQAFKGNTRTIYLNGEAKFTVRQNKKMPFIVSTKDMNVEALGTVFNISSYPDNPYTTTTLAQGKVKVDIKTSEETFLLSPNEQVIYDKVTGTAVQKQSRLDYVLAWEKGLLVFQSASLHTVIKEIERHYDVTVYFNSTDLNDKIITVKFIHDETLEESLHTLQQIITGFHYKTEGKRIYIY